MSISSEFVAIGQSSATIFSTTIGTQSWLLRKSHKTDKLGLIILTEPNVPRIDIDDELFRYLQSNAVAYVETPNDTLRRLLQLDKAAKGVVAEAITAAPVSRKPKASLGRMIQAGLIKNGQKLHLRDYQGREVPGAVAYIGGDGVFADARRQRLYSMSDLAQELLKKQGYESSSVRGPSHWFTDDGRSITDIWEKHLRQSA